MRKIQLWGLPKGGTTIVCRYFHSLPDAFFISEPLSEFQARGYMDPWNDCKSIDEILASTGKSLVGFKECVSYPRVGDLHHWRTVGGWEVVAILRDPVDTWGSLIRHGSQKIGEFLHAAGYFMDAAKDFTIIRFDRFCEDPHLEVELATGIEHPVGIELKKLEPQRYGDPEAFVSDLIHPVDPQPVTDGDRGIIEDSEAYALYCDLVK